MNLKLRLKRVDGSDQGLFGQLTIDDSNFTCVTLERHDLYIPAGTYPIELYNSPEHGLVPWIKDVPGRSYIEIHEGNWEFNSRGCILVGQHRAVLEGKAAIDNSRATLKQLVDLIKKANDCSITIT